MRSPVPTPTPGCTGTFRVIRSGFGRESAHEQCQLRLSRHVDRSGINSLYIFGGATASVQFYKKLDDFHFAHPLVKHSEQSTVHFLKVE